MYADVFSIALGTCRKSVASAFNTSNMKAQFPNIRLACGQLIDILKSMKGDIAVDMDSALCRESLDVIGEIANLFTAVRDSVTCVL